MDWAINIAWAMNAYKVCRMCDCVDVNAEPAYNSFGVLIFVFIYSFVAFAIEWVCNCMIAMWMQLFFSQTSILFKWKQCVVCGVWLGGWMRWCKRYNTIYNNNVIIIPGQRAQSFRSFLHFIFVSCWINK